MRLTRRGILGAGTGAAAAFGGARLPLAWAETREPAGAGQVTVEAKPIASLYPPEPDRTKFGALTFRSGLVLTSAAPGFGGLSGLWRSPDGRQLVAVTDRAQWLTASVHYDGPRLAGLDEARLAAIRNADGEPLRRAQGYDTESLAITDDGTAYVGVERLNEVLRFAWGRDGVLARGSGLPVPPELKQLPNNEGLEALAVAPARHPLAGSVVAIAERARSGDDAATRGWVLTGSRPFGFDVVRRDGFDITDLVFLPSGEALLLERRFRILTGVACRIRRIAADAFRPDAAVDGEVIFEADRSYEIDNMEGIAIHEDRSGGGTVVTLVSDNNFSILQRTLLLEFALS